MPAANYQRISDRIKWLIKSRNSSPFESIEIYYCRYSRDAQASVRPCFCVVLSLQIARRCVPLGLFCPEARQVKQRVKTLLKACKRTILKLSVEIHSPGKEVRAGQSHIGETSSVRTAADRLN